MRKKWEKDREGIQERIAKKALRVKEEVGKEEYIYIYIL